MLHFAAPSAGVNWSYVALGLTFATGTLDAYSLVACALMRAQTALASTSTFAVKVEE
jgi:hypothetical protein